MPFREKIAWLTLVGIAGAFGWYFGSLARVAEANGTLPAASFGLLIPTVILLTVFSVVVGIAIALHRPDEANAPADERDRDIARRASSIAYTVLVTTVILAISLPLFGFGMTMVLNAIIAAVVLAEMTRCILEIGAYRRAR